MKVYELKRRQKIELPVERVFSFFERPENLAKLTPPSLGFQILTPSPIEMKAGCLIDYTIRVMGLPVRWSTLITDYDRPHRFADVQLRGPYSYWHHTHMFEAVEGGTMMTDIVRHALPFGLLGRMAHSLAVRGQLRRIFDYRSRVLMSHLGKSGGDHSGGTTL